MSLVYQHPHYYALAYRWNTDEECDFLEAALRRWSPQPARKFLDLGCGTGRHLLEFAARGYDMAGIDPSSEMVAYTREQAMLRGIEATVREGSLQRFEVEGLFDAAYCFMDTFRFLLSRDDIVQHLQCVAACVPPQGLYVTDFWVPRAADRAIGEHYEWEQRSETTHVRVEYVQYPETFDSSTRTFEDELIFHVSDDGEAHTIRGGRTRTRLLLPDEWRALVEQSGVWRIVGLFDGFDLNRGYGPQPQSWRMVTVLQRTPGR